MNPHFPYTLSDAVPLLRVLSTPWHVACAMYEETLRVCSVSVCGGICLRSYKCCINGEIMIAFLFYFIHVTRVFALASGVVIALDES
jgi:hypothetical protein